MSHVFLSYKREDEIRVGRIARALECAGLDVWWDRGLPGGESWHSNIETKLQDASCVVVIWSAQSAGQEGGFVREEARRGLSRNLLVPVLIDSLSELPLGFGEIQAIDLTRWRGDRSDPYFLDLVATVRAKIANTPIPAARGPKQRIARRLMWGSASSAGLAILALFAFNVFGVSSHVCTIPGPQPALSDACGTLGVGDRPNREERLAWESRQPGSCPALREHIARFPTGAYRSEAADLLTARKISHTDSWTPATRSLALFQPTAKAAANETAARARALAQAMPEAERLCRGFGAGSLFKYESSSVVADRWTCARGGRGVACGFDGRAECVVQERRQVEQEHCG